MSSFQRILQRSGLLVSFLLAGSGFSAVAQADADLDILRSIAAEPSPAPSAAAAQTRKRPAARADRQRAERAVRARPGKATPKLRLTAEQRGSGRVDVLTVSNAPTSDSPLPAIERKGAGLSAGLIAARSR
jgi:hypothetical protein